MPMDPKVESVQPILFCLFMQVEFYRFAFQRRPQEKVVEFILIFLEILRGSKWCYLFMVLTNRQQKWFQKSIYVSFEDLIRSSFSLEVAWRHSPRGVNSVISYDISFSGFAYFLFSYVCVFKHLNFILKACL